MSMKNRDAMVYWYSWHHSGGGNAVSIPATRVHYSLTFFPRKILISVVGSVRAYVSIVVQSVWLSSLDDRRRGAGVLVIIQSAVRKCKACTTGGEIMIDPMRNHGLVYRPQEG